ncbi:MAG: hypothetical protein ACT4OP_06635 [Actinomycetota bacterium]
MPVREISSEVIERTMPERLRPIERRMLALHDQGMNPAEIARRFRRGPVFVSRVLSWTAIPRTGNNRRQVGLRPVERRVLDLRAQGLSHAEVGRRFGRTAGYARRIEGLANLRSDLGLA